MAPPFRGSDEVLESEIATLERIGRIRTRRAAAELKEIDRDLRELRRERAARRRVRADTSVPASVAESSTASG